MMRWLFLCFSVVCCLCVPAGLITASTDPGNSAPLTLMQQPGQKQSIQLPQVDNTALQELQDIYGPVRVAEEINYPLLLTIGLAVLLGAGLLFWFLKIRKKPLPPPVPPWETALKQMQQARSLIDAGTGRQYMDRASCILRDYIESRFTIQSTRQTTEEFLVGLESRKELQAYKRSLQDFLQAADMAKFARHTPPRDTLLGLENELEKFINSTIPTGDNPPKGGKQ